MYSSLRNERTEVRKIGDIMILNSIQDVGVGLFYKLVSSYDSQISEYFPTKLFIRKIIDKLGQVDQIFINAYYDKNTNKNIF